MGGTDGHRIYAIGDVHGCRDALAGMMTRIRDDLAARPHDRPRIVFLGDYVDRGPDTRGVIEDLISMRGGAIPAAFLLGNHDLMMLTYLDDPVVGATDRYHWFDGPLGGTATLRSYGVSGATPHDPGATHAAFLDAVPDAHHDFFERLELMVRIGGYVFVHAGIAPGIPLEEQAREDLVWIRAPFLYFTGDHGFVVVHGHTPVDEIEHHGNRINVDTGAVYGGKLSCVVLEDDRVWDLAPGGPVPMAPGYGIT